jgi:hypothetical protein
MKKLIVRILLTVIVILAGLFAIGLYDIKVNSVTYNTIGGASTENFTDDEVLTLLNLALETFSERISKAESAEEIVKILDSAAMEFVSLTPPTMDGKQSMDNFRNWFQIGLEINNLYGAAFDKIVELKEDYSYTSSYGELENFSNVIIFEGYKLYVTDTLKHPLWGNYYISSPMFLPTGEGEGYILIDPLTAEMLNGDSEEQLLAQFSVWHEIGHLEQSKFGLFDPRILGIRNPLSRVREQLEVEADKFAVEKLNLTKEAYVGLQDDLQHIFQNNNTLRITVIPELYEYREILDEFLKENIQKVIQSRAIVIFG